MSEVFVKVKLVKEVVVEMIMKIMVEKDEVFSFIVNGFCNELDFFLLENVKDIENGKENGLILDVIDCFKLDEKCICDIVDVVEFLIDLVDLVGEFFEMIEKENGLFIEKICVLFGVVGMIYEVRLNVIVDVVIFCLKIGNVVVLWGSFLVIYSNKVFVNVIYRVFE